jgi:hypothetical protein
MFVLGSRVARGLCRRRVKLHAGTRNPDRDPCRFWAGRQALDEAFLPGVAAALPNRMKACKQASSSRSRRAGIHPQYTILVLSRRPGSAASSNHGTRPHQLWRHSGTGYRARGALRKERSRDVIRGQGQPAYDPIPTVMLRSFRACIQFPNSAAPGRGRVESDGRLMRR